MYIISRVFLFFQVARNQWKQNVQSSNRCRSEFGVPIFFFFSENAGNHEKYCSVSTAEQVAKRFTSRKNNDASYYNKKFKYTENLATVAGCEKKKKQN